MVIKEVFPTKPEVQQLIEKLNHYQSDLYGTTGCNLESAKDLVKNNALMLGAFSGKILVGIGAIKLKDDYAQIKRMFIEPDFRSQGIAKQLILKLESHALKNSLHRICLETGNKHDVALNFYNKMGYYQIEKFGCYEPNEISIYFEKQI